MDADKLLSAEGIEERAAYYSKWGADIRAMNGASVDADHSEQTAFVLRALIANAEAQHAALSSLRAEVLEAIEPFAVFGSGEALAYLDECTTAGDTAFSFHNSVGKVLPVTMGDVKAVAVLADRLSRPQADGDS